jgi:outer membrane protein OmpA-like peptidoglycan-associated protein
VVGTFTPVNADFKPAGTREAYRFCLRLADLKTGTIVAQSIARAAPDGVDSTPTAFFADSPAWTTDPAIKSYIDTCQTTKVGDPIPPAYLNGIITASMVNQAIDAYDAGDYRQALDLYTAARASAAGDQLRIYNGLYLTYAKLGDMEHAAEAFGDIVDYGLRNKRLGVKLLFRAGSTVYAPQPFDDAYDMWLTQIAQHSVKTAACLMITGHTSAEGSAVLNNQLSSMRAQYVKERLEQVVPALHDRTIAVGAGSLKNLVGTGTDDLADLLDRRVEFEVIPACAPTS